MLEVGIHVDEESGLRLHDTLEDARGESAVIWIAYAEPDVVVVLHPLPDDILCPVWGVVVHHQDVELRIHIPESIDHPADVGLLSICGENDCAPILHDIPSIHRMVMSDITMREDVHNTLIGTDYHRYHRQRFGNPISHRAVR